MSKTILRQVSNIDIRLLRIFRVVRDSGGISAAELELNIGRSTISRHIKDLEIRLGMTLCHRGRGGFSLTHNGEIVYDATLKLIGSLENFHAEINDVHNNMTGEINIALFDKTISNPECKLSKALQLFDDIAPKVNINIYVETLHQIECGILDGRFQIGIIPTHRKSSSLQYETLFHEQMTLYCSSEHALFKQKGKDSDITDDEIKRYNYAGLGYHSPNMIFSHEKGIKRAATCYNQEAIAHLVLSGRYLGHLPEHYARSMVEQNLIRPLDNQNFQYRCEFASIANKTKQKSRVLSTFLDCLSEAHKSTLIKNKNKN